MWPRFPFFFPSIFHRDDLGFPDHNSNYSIPDDMDDYVIPACMYITFFLCLRDDDVLNLYTSVQIYG